MPDSRILIDRTDPAWNDYRRASRVKLRIDGNQSDKGDQVHGGVSLGTMHHAEVMLVGSANVDLVVRTHRFPSPGETLQGTDFHTFPGGKGANQAVAVAKLGGQCGLIAKIGTDAFGEQLLQSLQESGVDTRLVSRVSDCATGVAVITVDEAGQNTIVVAPGTNNLLTPNEVESGLKSVTYAVLLVQMEIPIATVVAASIQAKNKIFILNPAPARPLPDELLARVDYLTPNETETEILTGVLPVDDSSCTKAASLLMDRGVKNIVFTLGEKGSFFANRKVARLYPSIRVKPVDTTAAGDAFNGALALCLARGDSIERAISVANITGALSSTKAGAQASMPSMLEVLDRL